MARTLARALAALAAVLAATACAESPTGDEADSNAPMLAVDSLRTEDGQSLPCCATDTADAHATTVAGVLTLRHLASYSDTVYTPAGPMSGACVHGIPNGATEYRNGLVVLPDGSGYLLIPCDTGTFSLTLTRRRDFAGGRTDSVLVRLASGSFGAKPGTLRLHDHQHGANLPTAISWDTIAVVAGGHALRFLAGPTH